MTHEEIRLRALSAENILKDEVFNDVFEELKESYITKWENTPEDDQKQREMLYNRVKAIQEVKREFIRLLNAYKMINKR